jgi:hypothetical protein
MSPACTAGGSFVLEKQWLVLYSVTFDGGVKSQQMPNLQTRSKKGRRQGAQKPL